MHDKHQKFFDEQAAEWDLNFTAEDLDRLRHIVDKIGIKKGSSRQKPGAGPVFQNGIRAKRCE